MTTATIRRGLFTDIGCTQDNVFSYPISADRDIIVYITSQTHPTLTTLSSKITIQKNDYIKDYVQVSNTPFDAFYDTIADQFWETVETTSFANTVAIPIINSSYYRIGINTGDYNSADGAVYLKLSIVDSNSTPNPLTLGELQALFNGELNQIVPGSAGAFKAKGNWDASTNTPTLNSGVGNPGDWYIVSVAGSTNLDGNNTWNQKDFVIFDSVNSVWEHISGGSGSQWITNGSSIYYNNGYVGIGTTTPQTPLDVQGDVTMNGNLLSTGTFRFGIPNGATAGNEFVVTNHTDNTNFSATIDVNNLSQARGLEIYNCQPSNIALSVDSGITLLNGPTSINSGSPDPSAILDVNSFNQGALLPRMNTIAMNNISFPGTGLIIYNTDVNSFYEFNGSFWSLILNDSSTIDGGIF